MRWIVWILLIAAAAIGTALLMQFNHGNVAIFWPPYRIDLSVNLAVLALVAAFLALHLVLVGIAKAIDLPLQVRQYRERRSRELAVVAFRDSLLALFEGRFGRAERLAQQARTAGDLAGLGALIGARAAHRMSEYERRDQWLEEAREEAGTHNAALATAAELAVEQRQPQQALSMIEALQARGARHIHSLRLALRAHEQAEHWDRVLLLVRQLEKRDALHPAATRGLKLRALRALFAAEAVDSAGVRRLWNSLGSEERAGPEVIEAAAQAAARTGDAALAGSLIELGMRDQISEGLLECFLALRSVSASERLQQAQLWHEQFGDDPRLMLALGRLCVDEGLWGKAEGYLRVALRGPLAAQAHCALAVLYEQTDRGALASRHYREAAQLELDWRAPAAEGSAVDHAPQA